MWIKFWTSAFKINYKTSRKQYWVTIIINFGILCLLFCMLLLSVLKFGESINDLRDYDTQEMEELRERGDEAIDEILEIYDIKEELQLLAMEIADNESELGAEWAAMSNKYSKNSESLTGDLIRTWLLGRGSTGDTEYDTELIRAVERINEKYNLEGVNKVIINDFKHLIYGVGMNERQHKILSIIEETIPDKVYDSIKSVLMRCKLLMIFNVLLIIPTISLQIRRCHDVGTTGWMCLLYIIPVIGIVVILSLSALNKDALGERDEEYCY